MDGYYFFTESRRRGRVIMLQALPSYLHLGYAWVGPIYQLHCANLDLFISDILHYEVKAVIFRSNVRITPPKTSRAKSEIHKRFLECQSLLTFCTISRLNNSSGKVIAVASCAERVAFCESRTKDHRTKDHWKCQPRTKDHQEKKTTRTKDHKDGFSLEKS